MKKLKKWYYKEPLREVFVRIGGTSMVRQKRIKFIIYNNSLIDSVGSINV